MARTLAQPFTIATKNASHRRFRWRVALKAVASLVLLVVVPLLAAGTNFLWRDATLRGVALPAYDGAMPPPKTHDPSKKVAVVLASAHGVEMTDFLPPYEILARSGAFDVFAVAPSRTVLPILNSNGYATTLDFVPDLAYDEYESAVGRAPDVVVVPWMPGHTPERDPEVLSWIRSHAGPNTTLLTICAGAQILAETGLLDGHAATTHTRWFGLLEPRYRATTWVHDVRWVDDGQVISSTNLASGIDASLHTVDRFAGRAVAEDVARQLGYRETRYLDDPRASTPPMPIVPVAVNAVLRAGFSDLGVLLYDGVSETGLAGMIDPPTSTYVVRTHVLAPERTPVRSRNGLALIPRYTFQAGPRVERAILPAGDATPGAQQVLQRWASARPDVRAEQPYTQVGRGESAYDVALRDLARSEGEPVAWAAGTLQLYPVDGLPAAAPALLTAPATWIVWGGGLAALMLILLAWLRRPVPGAGLAVGHA